MLIYLLICLAVVALLLLGSRIPNQRLGRFLALPDHRYAPAFIGVVTGAVVWYVWGSLNATAPVHDEASYLLQARMFAHFHWTMPSPPLPEFFEQYHVFVTPTFASKYPPGHALMLVPGIWLSLPGLMPVVLSGLAAALLFMIVRRTTTAWIAVLTVVLWLPTKANLRFRGSYMSESTSSFLWLLGWWALLEWRRQRSTKWLLVIAGCVAWMGITRPFTAVAYAIPLGAIVIADLVRRREWRPLLRPALLGLAIMAIVPVWNAKTLGNWRTAPVKTYSDVYFPYDVLGFGAREAPPQRALPEDMQHFTAYFKGVHARHTVDRLPSTFLERWMMLTSELLHGWRFSFVLFTIVGLAVLGAAGWFAVGSALLLTLVYLAFAHPLDWTIYYLEIFPLIPFVTALGIGAVATAIVSPRAHLGKQLVREWGPRQSLGIALVVLGLLWPAARDTRYAHRYEAAIQNYHDEFRRLLARIPAERSIVFVRYTPTHVANSSLIANEPDLATARTWIVYDRGAENARLAAVAPERATYLFDEATFSLRELRYDLAQSGRGVNR